MDKMSAANRKREREDKIGKLMGDYLLKGYKMLSTTCNYCGTILLKDRTNQDYCIGCCEVDKRASPISSQKTSTEVKQETDTNLSQVPCSITDNCKNKDNKDAVNTPDVQQVITLGNNRPTHFEQSTIKLQERITWATTQLGHGNSVEMDIKLSELIYTCGKALKALRELQE